MILLQAVAKPLLAALTHFLHSTAYIRMLNQKLWIANTQSIVPIAMVWLAMFSGHHNLELVLIRITHHNMRSTDTISNINKGVEYKNMINAEVAKRTCMLYIAYPTQRCSFLLPFCSQDELRDP